MRACCSAVSWQNNPINSPMRPSPSREAGVVSLSMGTSSPISQASDTSSARPRIVNFHWPGSTFPLTNWLRSLFPILILYFSQYGCANRRISACFKPRWTMIVFSLVDVFSAIMLTFPVWVTSSYTMLKKNSSSIMNIFFKNLNLSIDKDKEMW